MKFLPATEEGLRRRFHELYKEITRYGHRNDSLRWFEWKYLSNYFGWGFRYLLQYYLQRLIERISSSKEIFDESAKVYQEALYKSGFKHKLTYMRPENLSSTDKNRTRRIIWFNPPYSKSVSSNVGRCFLKLIEKHFPKHHKFREVV